MTELTFLREVALYYAAGLMDGEGSICLTRKHASEHRSPAVTFPSTTFQLVQYMKEHFGGCISRKRKYKKRHLSSWIWALRGDAALEFLQLLASRLREPEKSRRAYLLVARYKRVTPRNGRYTPDMLEQKTNFEREFFKYTRKKG